MKLCLENMDKMRTRRHPDPRDPKTMGSTGSKYMEGDESTKQIKTRKSHA